MGPGDAGAALHPALMSNKAGVQVPAHIPRPDWAEGGEPTEEISSRMQNSGGHAPFPAQNPASSSCVSHHHIATTTVLCPGATGTDVSFASRKLLASCQQQEGNTGARSVRIYDQGMVASLQAADFRWAVHRRRC